jgi:hypothetical protein
LLGCINTKPVPLQLIPETQYQGRKWLLVRSCQGWRQAPPLPNTDIRDKISISVTKVCVRSYTGTGVELRGRAFPRVYEDLNLTPSTAKKKKREMALVFRK